MYLKALEIQGFKSFPDKTVLNFGEDITAIVGPNGSGKSNISDAIRWVMGEQSTRSLRGSKMEDVIFGGTEKRNQMGFAQVTLVIDNTEHIFAMDESEVAVTRRYYRSGESEYYINKQAVRLKDVNELFMDTGMGREGYSIIGQGRIDEILSVKSTDRREIFEEAAGISKFRHRKEESERKLDHTEENLVRINDKIAELELQVEPLREQAEKAKRYLVLRDELRLLEISVWLENLDTLRTGKIKLEADWQQARQEVEAARGAVDAMYAATEQFRIQMQENDQAQEQLRQDNAALEQQIAQQEAAAAVQQGNVENSRSNLEQLQQELETNDGRTGELEQQITRQQEKIRRLESEMQVLESEMETLLAQARQAAESAGAAADQTKQLEGRRVLAMTAAADARAEYSALLSALNEMQTRSEAADAEAKRIRAQLEEDRTQAKACGRALEEAREEAEAVDNVIAGHTMKMESRRKRDQEAAQKKLDLTMEENNLDSRIRFLSEMEKEYEGFQKAVRLVMQAAEHHTLRGIHGPVVSLLQTDRDYTVAIEIALGGGAQNIVVEREEDAKAAIAFLKQKEGGRATFLPMTAIRGRRLQEKGPEQEYGFVGIAQDLVRYDATYEQIITDLLGQTVVVEDLDCGIAMARKYQNRFRIVTLDGQVINRGGSMTGGSVSQKTGILSRANELESLKLRQGEVRQRLAAAEKEAADAHRELEKAQYELSVAQEQHHTAENEVGRLQGEKNQYEALISGREQQLSQLEAEQQQLTQRSVQYRQQLRQAQEKEAQQNSLCQEYQQQILREQEGQDALNRQSSDLGAEISDRSAGKAARRAERDAMERELENLKNLQADLQKDQQGRLRRQEEYRLAIQAAEEEIRRCREAGAGLHSRLEEGRKRLNQLVQSNLAIEAQRSSQEKRSRELNETLLTMERSASQLEQKRATTEMEEKQLLDRLWESYELNYTTAAEQRVELESMAKANRRIGELKREIGGLGNVNVGAIEEFDRVNTRYTYLSDQRNDVSRAKEELLGIIENITREMTEIFAAQFDIINNSFGVTFTELFGGGKATLELEDPEDILNCGIEIKVQPPGKTLKTLSLLSGGEKAFVAIALYFSILKVHPTPFCVMDEIEAALDEANVVRFARYMRTITGKTQFIVITHRRGTMEEADVLYGVTMQERGVSRVLTVNMNELSRELRLKE